MYSLSRTLVGSLLASTALVVSAQEQTFNLNIPAQSLNTALEALGQKTGLHVFYANEIITGKTSPALSGSYTPQQAIEKLLAGTGLTYSFTANDVVAVKEAESGSDAASTLPAVKVLGKTVYDDTDPLNPDYNRRNSSTATKTDTPIMETPFSIQVVPKQVLDDQQAVRVEKALQNVSGVIQSTGNGGAQDSYVIRGFYQPTIYRDGVQIPALQGGATAKRETANLERIDVLKGPASLLFGRSEPGGIINLVTKQPQTSPFYSLQQQFGSFDFYRTTLDATGPLTKDDTLLYRFNMAYEDAGSFRDFHDGNERVFLAPVLTWNIGPRTKATFEYEFQHVDETFDIGIPPIGNRPAPVPRERSMEDPMVNRNVLDRNYVGFHWEHGFNDNWTLSQKFSMEMIDLPVILGSYVGSKVSPDGSFSRPFYTWPSKSDRYFTSLNLTGKFSTWDLKHTLLLGGDYYRMDDVYNGQESYGPDFNIFNPVYVNQIPQWEPDVYSGNITTAWHGVYAQDQIELPFNLYALGGLRYDSAEMFDNLARAETGNENRVSPRGGLLWRPLNWLSLYGSYTENFGVSNGNDINGRSLPPQTAQQWETGIKTEFWDGRLTSTVAYFDLTKQNLTVPDPANPLRSTAIGEAESRGIELDAAGELLPGWKLIGAYSYTPFAEVTNDGAGTNGGKRLPHAPEHSGSLWSTYDFMAGDLKGLKLGAGIRAVGQREGNTNNAYQLPGYATVNLMTSYGMKVGSSRLTFQLNLDNLIDKSYFLGSNDGNHIQFGAPRTFMGSIKVDF